MLDLSTSTDADLAVAAAVLAALDPDGDERCMVVGATARNILSLALGHGVPGRLTRDVDISVAVGSWGDLETFTGRLERVGRRAHTFRVLGCEVDVVPWGAVEDAARTITWPDGAVMNLVGMREAHAHRLRAVLPGGTRVAVPSVPGLAVLKLVAWADRGSATSRDAVDLAEVLAWQGRGAALESLYVDHADVLVRYDFDVALAGAHVLGTAMRDLLTGAAGQVAQVLDGQRAAALARAMPRSPLDPRGLVDAMASGLRGS